MVVEAYCPEAGLRPRRGSGGGFCKRPAGVGGEAMEKVIRMWNPPLEKMLSRRPFSAACKTGWRREIIAVMEEERKQ